MMKCLFTLVLKNLTFFCDLFLSEDFEGLQMSETGAISRQTFNEPPPLSKPTFMMTFSSMSWSFLLPLSHGQQGLDCNVHAENAVFLNFFCLTTWALLMRKQPPGVQEEHGPGAHHGWSGSVRQGQMGQVGPA